jgi:hypothetical protein
MRGIGGSREKYGVGYSCDGYVIYVSRAETVTAREAKSESIFGDASSNCQGLSNFIRYERF